MASTTGRTNYACFHCRRGFKHIYSAAPIICPGCNGEARHMGPAFKVPSHRLTNQWRKVELLAEAGIVFYNNRPLPSQMKPIRTLADGKIVARTMRQQQDTALTRPERVDPYMRSRHQRTAARLGQTQQQLRHARASRASKARLGDSTRVASLDREIAQLERHIARLKQVLR